MSIDPGEAQLLDDVETFGWHMITVSKDDEGPSFTYTVGLFKSYGHPELIVFGLPDKVMQDVLHVAATLIQGGRTFGDNECTLDLLNDDYPCVFRTVLPEQYEFYLGYAMWFYRIKNVDEFPALQLVWPDKASHFPWEHACAAGIRDLQPPTYEPLGRGAG